MRQRQRQHASLAALVVLAAAGLSVDLSSQTPARTVGLRIVVIGGEDAVNIIQQKTAVAPIVEVRDRNDQPVAGALVNFAIRGGRATFGGARALSATTDAAGRATAPGLTPLSNGTYQISVTATFEGQQATATISQTNVATTAAAQAVGTGAAVGAVAGAAAAGGGGGLPGVTIGAIAAAAGGGALVAVKAAGNDSSNSTGSTNPTGPGNPTGSTGPTAPIAPTPTTYSGPFSGQLIMTTNSSGSVCASTTAISGTMTITLDPRTDGIVSGRASTAGTQTEIAFTVSPLCQALPGPAPFNTGGPVTGTPGNFGYSFTSGGTGPTPSGGSVTVTNTTTFSGALSGGVITGTITHTQVSTGQSTPSGGPINGSGTTSFPVTLR